MNMKARFTCFALILVLMGISFAKYSGGSGTTEAPYLIATPNDLNAIGLDSNDWDKHFLLIEDINMADINDTQFSIIGNPTTPFSGTFDGEGHFILNIIIEDPCQSPVGLFGIIDGAEASLSNVHIVDANITANNKAQIGALVGTLQYGKVINCSVKRGYVTGASRVGGLAGDNLGGVLRRCHVFNCNVFGSYLLGGRIGGMVGYNDGTVTECTATGTVSSVGDYIGGLVGKNDEIVERCRVNCDLFGNSEYGSGMGGLVGRNENGSIIRCYAKCDIRTDGYSVGGLAGSSSGTIIQSATDCDIRTNGNNVGGLVGYFAYGPIIDSYATGRVEGDNYIGGLVGWSHEGNFSMALSTTVVKGYAPLGGMVGNDRYCKGSYVSCFWDSQINPGLEYTGSRCPEPNGVRGESTHTLWASQTYSDAGWDMVNVWDIGENQTYPFLRTHLPSDINKDDETNFIDLAILTENWLGEK
jgi:hypothetical protein